MMRNWTTLSVCVLLAASATSCINLWDWDDDWTWDPIEWCSDCWEPGWTERCWCDDADGCLCPETSLGACRSNSDCRTGEVCSLEGFCAPIVANCPLTDECLADPDIFVHSWQGIDPIYAGELLVGEKRGLVWIDIEFYDEHLYGEGSVVLDGRLFMVVATGQRNQRHLRGQLLDANGGRSYDWTYEAELFSASELAGSMHFADNDGAWTGHFHLYRISPCGCDISSSACSSDSECSLLQTCIDGACVDQPIHAASTHDCQHNADCATGQLCIEGHCQAFCHRSQHCAAQEHCLSGLCVPKCSSSNDCAVGERCSHEVCLPIVPPCERNSDCGVGQSCEDGRCIARRSCQEPSDCHESEKCEDGFCESLTNTQYLNTEMSAD